MTQFFMPESQIKFIEARKAQVEKDRIVLQTKYREERERFDRRQSAHTAPPPPAPAT